MPSALIKKVAVMITATAATVVFTAAPTAEASPVSRAAAVPGLAPAGAVGGTYLDENGQVLAMDGAIDVASKPMPADDPC